MFYDVELFSNGKIENYPRSIPISLELTVKHHRALSDALKISEIAFEMALSAILNEKIDWSRVTGIKSVDELTHPDRLKLFLYQVVNSPSGGNFNLTFECPECGSRHNKNFNINDLKEFKLEKKLGEKIIRESKLKNGKLVDDPEGKILLILKVPRAGDTFLFNRKLINLKEEVLEKINKVNGEELSLINNLKNQVKKREHYKLLADPVIDNKDKIESCEKEIKLIYDRVEELRTEEYIKNKNKKIEEILKENYMEVIDVENINSVDDLFFDTRLNELLLYYTCIKDNYREVLDYINYMDNFSISIIRNIRDFVQAAGHGLDGKITLKCDKCGHEVEDNLSLKTSFFFQIMD